ncbi:PREDICTED: eukaryotic translation initiation factor 3 subunit B-like [Fragaria vesca subsp. vesca]|uniref:eukaryotic translation initiation factor 3 subunit B-like n=1 Tax=Fragaria vesca subsp. vesca TaxID=101020 RepID=UPI0002C3523B|nr:PREDICTED: eukaryotic translation initiation factor 3 subunit B-like [Fragaria vesca subsp. vesca]
MTVDSATMEDMEAKADQLGIQFSSIDLNSSHPPHFNFSECQEVFYDENGFIPNIEFGGVIVVSNLPVVEAEMAQELESEIRVVFSEVGVIKEDGFSMPVNPTTQETLGHCFIEFNSQEEAALARNKRDGYKFGDCKMSVSLYDAFGSLAAIPGTGTYSEINASFCGSSRYPGSPSLLSPVTEEDEEPVYSDVSTADDNDEIMMWSEQENDMSSEEFREVIE